MCVSKTESYATQLFIFCNAARVIKVNWKVRVDVFKSRPKFRYWEGLGAESNMEVTSPLLDGTISDTTDIAS